MGFLQSVQFMRLRVNNLWSKNKILVYTLLLFFMNKEMWGLHHSSLGSLSLHLSSPTRLRGWSISYQEVPISGWYTYESLSMGTRRRSTKSSTTCLGSSNSNSNNQRCSADHSEPVHIIVVGGGVGGLAIASHLAGGTTKDALAQTQGTLSPLLKVTLFEKNEQVGGRMGSFTVTTKVGDMMAGPFRHERGPSLLLLPDCYNDFFTETDHGKFNTIGQYGKGNHSHERGFTMAPCIPAYQVIFDDGSCISLGFRRGDGEQRTEAEFISRRTMDQIEPNGSCKWDEYLNICEAYLDCGLPNFIEERFDWSTFPAFLQTSLRDYAKAWPLKPHSSLLDSLFQSDKMKALASFQDLYVGLEPYENNRLLAGGVFATTAPAVFGLLASIELHPTNRKGGVFAPLGGFQSVTTSMERLAQSRGVEIKCQSTVTKVQSDGVFVIHGCDPNQKPIFYPADFIVVNADLPYAKLSLLDPQHDPDNVLYDWDDSYRFSCGVIAFHWCIDKTLVDLNTHNVFLSTGSGSVAEASWMVLRDESRLPMNITPETPFNFYVHRPAHTDPSAAPEGMDSIMVLVPCPSLRRNATIGSRSREELLHYYQKLFDEYALSQVRRSVLTRLAVIDSLKDLSKHIIHEVVDTPATYAAKYNVAAGTPFGLSHGLAQLSLTRPGPFSTGLSNVCYCGASTRPGNGVPLVLTGAKLVAERLLPRIMKRVGEKVSTVER